MEELNEMQFTLGRKTTSRNRIYVVKTMFTTDALIVHQIFVE